MRAYSADLRERVPADCDAGSGSRAVAARYRVSESWVRRLKHVPGSVPAGGHASIDIGQRSIAHFDLADNSQSHRAARVERGSLPGLAEFRAREGGRFDTGLWTAGEDRAVEVATRSARPRHGRVTRSVGPIGRV